MKKPVNQSATNSTRFIIITNQKIFRKDAKKVSICFEIPNESGSLYHMLSHFIYNNLNMTRIESRPLEGRNWEYRFFIDFDGNLEDSAVKNALRGLRDEARNMRVWEITEAVEDLERENGMREKELIVYRDFGQIEAPYGDGMADRAIIGSGEEGVQKASGHLYDCMTGFWKWRQPWLFRKSVALLSE